MRHAREPADQRVEAPEKRRHHGSEDTDPEHVEATLGDQRMSALLTLGVGAQLHVEAELFTGSAEGREDDSGDGEHEEEPVAPLRVVDGGRGQSGRPCRRGTSPRS